jgi:biofilm protein TabA
MIVTHLDNLNKQLAMNAKFKHAIEFLRREGWRGHPDGTIEIDGTNVYALLQAYETQVPQGTVPFEGHHKYIDIQCVIEGKETIYWTPTHRLTPTIPYDDAKDIWFSHTPRNDATEVVLSFGTLAVFFPEDAHATRQAAGQPAHVRKLIVKIAV